MKTTWRPEGWENPYLTKWHGEIPCDDGCDVEVFEAGADALLKALYKLAEESPTKTFTIDSREVRL